MRIHRAEEPSYAGVATFEKIPLVLDAAGLDGADVAVLGAPTDDSVSNRSGARFGPRAIRVAYEGSGSPSRPHIDLGIDAFAELRIVDFGDAEVIPADAGWTRASIERTVGEVVDAGATPVVLGGDHSIAYPDIKAVLARFEPGSVAVVQFDAHADTATDLAGVKYSHGSPFRHLVDQGHLPGERLIQVGLRGYWPPPEEFDWARRAGVRWHRMEEVRTDGLDAVLERIVTEASEAGELFLSVDVDVLDPAFAPGTGTPCSGGMTTYELLTSVRRLVLDRGLAGMEVVEVCPPYDHAEITAIAAHDVVLEALSALALSRHGKSPAPQDP
jgi:agmatinase